MAGWSYSPLRSRCSSEFLAGSVLPGVREVQDGLEVVDQVGHGLVCVQPAVVLMTQAAQDFAELVQVPDVVPGPLVELCLVAEDVDYVVRELGLQAFLLVQELGLVGRRGLGDLPLDVAQHLPELLAGSLGAG